jgi:hypothetical protein
MISGGGNFINQFQQSLKGDTHCSSLQLQCKEELTGGYKNIQFGKKIPGRLSCPVFFFRVVPDCFSLLFKAV